MRSGVLAARIGRRRHHLGRAVVGPDDRRLAAAGRTDIGAIGKGSARPHHGQRQHGGNRHQAARALLRRGLFLVVALIGVRIVRIGRIALIVVLAGFDPPVQRIVVTRRIGLLLRGRRLDCRAKGGACSCSGQLRHDADTARRGHNDARWFLRGRRSHGGGLGAPCPASGAGPRAGAGSGCAKLRATATEGSVWPISLASSASGSLSPAGRGLPPRS